MTLITLLGIMKGWAQKACIPNKILWTSWTLPTYESFLAGHEVIFYVILSIKGCHCMILNFFVDRGTPRYLKGRSPVVNPKCCKICCCSAIETPPKYTALLLWLACSPDIFVNGKNLWYTASTDIISPLAKIKRSSAKHKWLILSFEHLDDRCTPCLHWDHVSFYLNTPLQLQKGKVTLDHLLWGPWQHWMELDILH